MFAFKAQPLALLLLLLAIEHEYCGTHAAVDPTGGGVLESPLEFYMHDILGGSGPTARPVTGLLGSIYNGQVPFARPLGFRVPQGGVAIPNPSGAIPTFSADGVPLGTGLSGTSYVPSSEGRNAGVQTQVGADGLGLGFGTITVIDDQLTMGPDLGTPPIGRAQGVYVASSADGSSHIMAFTALLEGGEFGDSLNMFGAYHLGVPTSRLSVTGGTGKFKHAGGFADVQPLIPTGQHVTDGAETLLRITVHLVY
ncbi:unnamed protein product [Victoria cruziana]